MTIKELVEYQQQSGHICLIKQGLFFRAYNQGAVLLNRLFGYQIKCKFSKSCDTMLYYVGFPSAIVDKVTAGVVGQGGSVVSYDKNYKVRLFNTSNATPLEALQFIARLQNQLNAESVKSKDK